MDSALLREREAFKRRAMAMPTVENKKVKKDKSSSSGPSSSSQKEAKQAPKSESAKAKLDLAQMKSMGGSSQFKFGVLAKIVRHMKQRHMEGEDHPLDMEEMLDETNQLDVTSKTRAWLMTEALKNNPKLLSFPEGKYLYKPPYTIMNKKGLVKLLKKHDLKGLGGIFLEDVQESLPKWEKAVKQLVEENKVLIVTRPVDKKKVLFHHDHTSDFDVDEEFTKLWRSVAVDSVDEAKIDEYLEKHGIRSMTDQGLRKVMPRQIKRKQAKRKARGPKDNDHLKDVLEDYNEMTADKANK